VHFALIAEFKPVIFEELVKDVHRRKAMEEEIDSIEKN